MTGVQSFQQITERKTTQDAIEDGKIVCYAVSERQRKVNLHSILQVSLHLTSGLGVVRSIAMSMSVCLSVFVYLCPVARLRNNGAKVHQILCMLMHGRGSAFL